MEEIQEEPLYAYRRISRPSVRISDQYCLGVISLQEIDELFQLDFDEVSRIYQRCFTKKTKGLAAILSIFAHKGLLKIINYFVLLTVISHNEKLKLHSSHVFEPLKLKINNLYKQIIFDKQSDNIEFLYYCVEIVHTQLYGNFLNSKVLFKYISNIFGTFYEIKGHRRSIISLALPRSEFEKCAGNGKLPTRKPGSPKMFTNSTNGITETQPFMQTIQDHCFKLKNSYEKMTHEFVDLMKIYTKYQKRKKEFAIVQKKPEMVIDHMSKPISINVNGLSSALQNNTHNQKKEFCITFRDLSRRAQFEFAEGIRNVSRQLDVFNDSSKSGRNSLEVSARTATASKKAFYLQKNLRSRRSQVSSIAEHPDLFNEFEKNVKEMDSKFSKAQKYLSTANMKGPNKEFVSQINESDFDTINQFYLRLRKEKEAPVNRVLTKDYSVRKLMRETDRKKNISQNISKEKVSNDKHASLKRSNHASFAHISSVCKWEKLPSVRTTLPKKQLMNHLKSILELNPVAQGSSFLH